MYIKIVKKNNVIYYILVVVDNKTKVKVSKFIDEKLYNALKTNNIKVFER